MKVIEEGPRPNRVWTLKVYTALNRWLFSKFIEDLPEIKITRMPKIFSFFRESEFKGEIFCVEIESFSYSSYEIYPKKRGCKLETIDLKNEIENANSIFKWF